MSAAHFLRWPDGCAAQVERGCRHRSLFARTLTLAFTDTLFNCVCACMCTNRLHPTAKMYHTLGVRHPHRACAFAVRRTHTHACTRKHTQAHTHMHLHAHTNAHARTCMCAHAFYLFSLLSLSLACSFARSRSLSVSNPPPPSPSLLARSVSVFLFFAHSFSRSRSRSLSLSVSQPLSPSLPPSLSLHPLSQSLVCALSEPHITISRTHTATLESLSAGYQYHAPNITLDCTAP